MLLRRLRPTWLVLGAAVLLYLVHTRLLDARLQDDAFISFRYARNLAAGHGLVFNPGERVEGYTNFLWTLVHAVPFFFSQGVDPVPFARALSILSGIATVVASFSLAREQTRGSKLLPLAVPVLMAANWAFTINSMTGLETTFFSFLITLATLVFARELSDRRYRGSSLVYALAWLTRPETAGLFALSVLAVLPVMLRRPAKQPPSRAPLWRYPACVITPFVTIAGMHTALRLAYYGELVPNTFFVKMGVDLPAGMATPSTYLLGFADKAMDLFGVFSALIVIFALGGIKIPAARLATAGIVFACGNIFVSGADFMIGYRYLVPYLPLFFSAAAGGASLLAARWRRKWQAKDPGATGIEIEVAFLIFTLFTSAKWIKHSQDRLRSFEQIRRRVAIDANRALGEWLGRHLDRSATVVTLEVGEIGFVSGLRIVDLSGLTDRAIAKTPGNMLDRAIDTDALFATRPEAFVFVSERPVASGMTSDLPPSPGDLARNNPYWPPGSSARLLGHPLMREQYNFVAEYPPYRRLMRDPDGGFTPAGPGVRGATPITYFLELYVRKDVSMDGANGGSDAR